MDSSAVILIAAAAAAAAGAFPNIESVAWSMRYDRRWHHIRDLGVVPWPRREGDS